LFGGTLPSVGPSTQPAREFQDIVGLETHFARKAKKLFKARLVLKANIKIKWQEKEL